MKISFAICTHNEGHYVTDLLHRLVSWINRMSSSDPNEYEIVIVDDFSTEEETVSTLDRYMRDVSFVKVYKHALNGNFSEHKNYLNSRCTGDWILNLDADEWLPESMLDVLALIVESNPQVEAFWLPRVNTVDGLTFAHVQKWKWVIGSIEGYRKVEIMDKESQEYKLLKMFDLIISEDGDIVNYYQPVICWPDLQMRFYKNDPKIQWSGKVHERLMGFTHFSILPQDPQYAIQHHKEIVRQEIQNAYYDTLI